MSDDYDRGRDERQDDYNRLGGRRFRGARSRYFDFEGNTGIRGPDYFGPADEEQGGYPEARERELRRRRPRNYARRYGKNEADYDGYPVERSDRDYSTIRDEYDRPRNYHRRGDDAYSGRWEDSDEQPYGPRRAYNVYDDDTGRREGPYAGRGPRGYRRSDERILEEVNERLTWHGGVDATYIVARVENGEVTLEGTVDSRRAKRMAEDAIESIYGVSDIHNHLRVVRGQDQTGEQRQQQDEA